MIRTTADLPLRLVAPGFLTVALISGLAAWNNFIIAITFLQSPSVQPVSAALYAFQQGFSSNYTLIAAAGILMLLPMIVLFVALQRHFVAGISTGGWEVRRTWPSPAPASTHRVGHSGSARSPSRSELRSPAPRSVGPLASLSQACRTGGPRRRYPRELRMGRLEICRNPRHIGLSNPPSRQPRRGFQP